MEVSTKCGLDPSGVWGAAGFALLQAGDFSGAREKFSRCMKVSELLYSCFQIWKSQRNVLKWKKTAKEIHEGCIVVQLFKTGSWHGLNSNNVFSVGRQIVVYEAQAEIIKSSLLKGNV